MTKLKSEAITQIVVHDLRALLFWAAIGVRGSVAGSYQDIEDIIESYAYDIDFKLDKPAVFAKRAAHNSGAEHD